MERNRFDTAEAQGVTAMQEAGQELGRHLLGATLHDAQGNPLPYPYRSDVPTQEYVRRLYETFLRRTPDTQAANWQTQADNPSLGRSSVLEQFLAMSAYAERSAGLYREIQWLIPDHLGTPRFIVERTGSAAGVKRSDYLPFGESANSLGGRTAGHGYGGESVRQGFTGYEEDAETGLDFAQARYYASGMGRFMSLDPLLASGKPANPQTWNRYAYVGNNPLVLTDPTGEDWYYSADQNKYQWAFQSPGYGYSKVENFTYYAGEEHQWVALNPFGNSWTGGHSSSHVAENSIDGSFVGWKTLQFFAGLSGVGEGSLANMGKILGLELPYVNEHSTPHRGGAGASTILQLTALPAIEGAVAEAGAFGMTSKSSTGEIFYRAMNSDHAATLQATGKLPASSETVISPSRTYVEKYRGTIFEFNLNKGTTAQLEAIGVRNTAANHPYSHLPLVGKGWKPNNAFFKLEGDNLVNIGLGTGRALNIFNANIQESRICRP